MASESESTDGNFDQFLAEHDLPILTDFWAEWCGPCKVMSPVLQELAQEWKGRLIVIKVNTDKRPQIANRFRITSIPTLILFKSGKEAHRISGAMPLANLKRELEGRL